MTICFFFQENVEINIIIMSYQILIVLMNLWCLRTSYFYILNCHIDIRIAHEIIVL